MVCGGLFDTAGQSKADNITRWDGQGWRPVGDGLQADDLDLGNSLPVMSLAVCNGSLYAGGSFSRSGTRELPGLGRWEGLPGSRERLERVLLSVVGQLGRALRRREPESPGRHESLVVASVGCANWDLLGSRVNGSQPVLECWRCGDQLFSSRERSRRWGESPSVKRLVGWPQVGQVPGLTNQMSTRCRCFGGTLSRTVSTSPRSAGCLRRISLDGTGADGGLWAAVLIKPSRALSPTMHSSTRPGVFRSRRHGNQRSRALGWAKLASTR